MNKNSIYQKKIRMSDQVLKMLINLCAALALALLAGIMGYVFYRGIPQINWQFLSTVQSSAKGTFGILGNIINTLYMLSLIHISFVFQETEDGLKCSHIHCSNPYQEMVGGELFPEKIGRQSYDYVQERLLELEAVSYTHLQLTDQGQITACGQVV